MSDLHELQTLNIDYCFDLSGFPQDIQRLINLKYLRNLATGSLKQFPQGLAELTGLRTLNDFHGGSGWSKSGYLKNLNKISGFLHLSIRLTDDLDDVVEDAREAELRKKIPIQKLEITFADEMETEQESLRMDVLDALEQSPNLRFLHIMYYKGCKLPSWITSLRFNQSTHIQLHDFNHMSSLPSLGKLPCLELLEMYGMLGLQFVGREFLGISATTTTTGDMVVSSSASSVTAGSNTIGFPKLKKLEFHDCLNWKEWEDITIEEEDSAIISLLPCLKQLSIKNCRSLTALPHRLLRKASSLELMHIHASTKLVQLYREKEINVTNSTRFD